MGAPPPKAGVSNLVTPPGFVTLSLVGFQIVRFEIFETNVSESKEHSTVSTVVSLWREDVLLKSNLL